MKRFELTCILAGQSYSVCALVRDTRSEVEAFLDECAKSNAPGYKVMMALLWRIAENGAPNNPTQFRRVDQNLYEIKAAGMRLLCFYDPDSNEVIILTHGWNKAKAREQQREIDRARRMRDEYLNSR